MATEGARILAIRARWSIANWPGVVVAILVATILVATGADLWRVWVGDASLGSAPLVPVISAALLWQRRAGLRSWAASSPFGAALLTVCALLYVGAYWADVEFLKPLSAIGILFGVCWFLGGWKTVEVSGGPLGILLFTIPWPTTLIGRLQLPLQLASTACAAIAARAIGIPVHRDGVTLSIVPDPTRAPTYVILVAQECSGLTSLVVLLTLGYIIALLTPVAFWKRAALFLATIPLALLANAARLTFILAVGASRGAALAQWVHDHEQPVLVFICALALMGLRALLMRGLPANPADANERNSSTAPVDAAPSNGRLRRIRWPLAIAALLLAICGTAYARKPEVGASGNDFLVGLPLPYNDWKHESLPLTSEEQSMLQPDAQLLRRYSGPKGETVELAVIAGHRKKTVHTPDYCLAGGGWDTLSQSDVVLDVGGHSVPATQALLIRNGERMVATYFFTDGETTTRNLPQFQVHQIMRRLAGRRTLGAMVRLLVSADENSDGAKRRTDDFSRAVLPAVFAALARAAR